MPSDPPPANPAETLFPEEPPRRRGRPKGSKNKPKAGADQAASGEPASAATAFIAPASGPSAGGAEPGVLSAAAKRSKPSQTPKAPKAPAQPKTAQPKAPKAPETLTKALSKLLAELTKDLRQALGDQPEAARAFEAEHRAAKDSKRTAETYLDWLESQLDQIAASWILSAVFVRFVEDNRLIDRPRLSGPLEPGPSGLSPLAEAKAAEEAHYDQHPGHGEAQYLAAVFADLARLPGLADLFDQRHAALWRLSPRPEGARALLGFFRQQDAETGQLRWSFVDPQLSTRFLGDLYQELSEYAQKRYALLQTPAFVERFLLDQTLEPALQDFGLEALRLIDPTCGSGHFLLGAFERLFDRWLIQAPGEERRTLVARALAAVHGVDVNPFAIAIARFRLLVAANRLAQIQRLAAAPNFRLNLAVGDSLLHGERFNELRGRQKDYTQEDRIAHLYSLELPEELGRILGQQYHVVVGNPPYITVKDSALNEAYRQRYRSCSGKYSLSVPFLERFVELAVEAQNGQPAGYTAQITSNSFMKREFGQKVIEEYFPRWDLTHVIDTSGAYIPGHGTPTVILLIRNRQPVMPSVRAVLGIRGEPSTPADPARGLVWSEILGALHRGDFAGSYVSSADVDRATFHKHPWSLGGGGAAELKELIEHKSEVRLGDLVISIGPGAIMGEDEVLTRPRRSLGFGDSARKLTRPLVEGDKIRDWSLDWETDALFPYDTNIELIEPSEALSSLWPLRTTMWDRATFSKLTYFQEGRTYWEYHQIPIERNRTPLSIAYAEIATHNHFVLDRGGKVFKQTAPVIKLAPDATEDDHFALLGVLNSSLAEFWFQQVGHNKGGPGGGSSKDEKWKDFYARNAAVVGALPVLRSPILTEIAKAIHALAFDVEVQHSKRRSDLNVVALQEELDWQSYRLFGLVGIDLVAEDHRAVPHIVPGERAFEILAAREVSEGILETRWFEWTDAKYTLDIPEHWPNWYADLVRRRIEAVRNIREIALIDSMGCKRRWESRIAEQVAHRESEWQRRVNLEAVEKHVRSTGSPVSLFQVFDAQPELLQLTATDPIDSEKHTFEFLAKQVEEDAVPFLKSLVLLPQGLAKHAAWQETWRLQRVEDPFLEQQEQLLAEHFGSAPAEQRRAREHVASWKTSDKLSKEKGLDAAAVTRLQALKERWMAIEVERRAAIGGETPPVPPKYEPKDFRSPALWRQRGKLDVPKERFISYPHCSPDGDPSLLLGWAGWNHLQRAEALVKILEARKREGWTGERLAPILLGLDELQFWLDKWHPDVAEEYQAFLEQETNQAGLTPAQVRAWTPPAAKRGRAKQQPG
jgi:hypothetical protein